jgi:hypothetical protein
MMIRRWPVCPRARAATLILQRDDKALEKLMANFVKGITPDMLDG